MVVARLCGGLGNQMFQYAFGRCLAEKRKDTLLLETSQLQSPPPHTKREYKLDIFNTSANSTSLDEIANNSGVLLNILQCSRGFHKEVFEYSGLPTVLLQGFWNSELYFIDVEQTLRKEFTFKAPLSQIGDNAFRVPVSESSVCLHVRRGDYLSAGGEHLGFVGSDYYERAIAFAAKRIAKPHFYIFSDDIKWCADNLRLKHPHTFVHHDQPADDCAEADLRLMVACRHFIIANSTFSWWAAWLGSKESSIVVAPLRWYRCDPFGSRDIVPARWTRL